MEAEKKGIKEMLELVAGLKALGLVVKEIVKDGHVNVADLAALPKLLEQHQVLIDALMGLGEMKDEMKDISGEEAMQLVAALVDAAKEIKGA